MTRKWKIVVFVDGKWQYQPNVYTNFLEAESVMTAFAHENWLVLHRDIRLEAEL